MWEPLVARQHHSGARHHCHGWQERLMASFPLWQGLAPPSVCFAHPPSPAPPLLPAVSRWAPAAPRGEVQLRSSKVRSPVCLLPPSTASLLCFFPVLMHRPEPDRLPRHHTGPLLAPAWEVSEAPSAGQASQALLWIKHRETFSTRP